MNRLIVVGNGFDLAHNLKTAYSDFLEYYLKEVIKKFLRDRSYDDPLISLYNVYSGMTRGIPLDGGNTIYEIIDWLSTEREYFKLEFKSDLLKKSLTKAKTLRWVDLENEYFDEVLSNLKKVRNADYKIIRTLNVQFEFLKMELENYLLLQQVDLESFMPDPDIKEIFTEQIQSDDIVLQRNSPLYLENVLFLNFNYTNTLSKYVNVPPKRSGSGKTLRGETIESLTHIHGQLGDSNNEIVFGFGDEYDEEYLKFESFKNNDVFRHIKSFAYFKTRNYDNLIRFLDSNEYQVFIIGHSCGLSDRTMFREIFEHTNCLSIKIFYHKINDIQDDFTEKTFDMARHFTNKNTMRKKIVKKPNSSFLPQYRKPDSG